MNTSKVDSGVKEVSLFWSDYRRNWVIWSGLPTVLLEAGLFYSHAGKVSPQQSGSACRRNILKRLTDALYSAGE